MKAPQEAQFEEKWMRWTISMTEQQQNNILD